LLKEYLLELPAIQPNPDEEYVHYNQPLLVGFGVVNEIDENGYSIDIDEPSSDYDENKTVEGISSQEINSYVFSVSQLGWINCDRFNGDRRPKINYFVHVNDPAATQVQLVFQDINSTMTGVATNKGILFTSVPKGAKVQIVAIEHDSIAPKMAVAPAIVGEQHDALAFEAFTLNKLKVALN